MSDTNFQIVDLKSDHPWALRVRKSPGWNALKSQLGQFKQKRDGFRHDTFAGQDPTAVVKAFAATLSDPTMLQYELERVGKGGPFTKNAYEHWKGNVYDYYAESTITKDRGQLLLLHACFAEVAEEIISANGGHVQLISLDEAFELATKGKNMGLPYCSRKGWEVKDGEYVHPEIIADYRKRAELLHSGSAESWEEALWPFTLLHRSQPKSMTEVKDRPVWCADKAEVFCSLTILKPLLEAMKKVRAFCGYLGADRLEPHLGAELPQWKHYISMDFSQFDALAGPLMEFARYTMVTVCPEADPFLPVLFDYYRNGHLVTPEGLIMGAHGLPSGVGLTNAIGSIINRAFAKYLMRRLGIESYCHFGYGDDALVLSNDIIEPKIIEQIAQEIGMRCNADKQLLSDDTAHFLKRVYFRNDCRGKYSVITTLWNCLFSEWFITARDMVNTEFIDDDGTRVVFTADDMAELDMTSLVILRFIMKLENCRHHGDFEKLVRYVRDNEPHKLHTSYFINIGRLRKLVRAGRSSIEQGIENFATVQLLLKWEAEEQSDPTHFVREVTPNMEPTRSQKREMEIAEIKAALALPIGDAAKKALEMRLEVLVNAPTLKQKKERSVEQIRAMTDKKLQKRLDELAKAKEAGNDQRVKELEFAIRQLKANLGIGAPVVVESNKARRERERQELIAILEVNLRDAMREGRVEDVIYYGAEINKLKVASEQASKSSDV